MKLPQVSRKLWCFCTRGQLAGVGRVNGRNSLIDSVEMKRNQLGLRQKSGLRNQIEIWKSHIHTQKITWPENFLPTTNFAKKVAVGEDLEHGEKLETSVHWGLNSRALLKLNQRKEQKYLKWESNCVPANVLIRFKKELILQWQAKSWVNHRWTQTNENWIPVPGQLDSRYRESGL